MSLLNARELQPFLVPDAHATGNVLGNGSYGYVEEVEIPGATCVAKKLHEALLPPPTEAHGADRMSSLFVSECRLMSKLRHPNIVQFLGVCFLPGSRLPALLMEKLLTDLHNLLEGNPGIPLSMKHSILVGVANGLVYLHNHDPPVIHRDLSARNVLLNSAMVAKIADLGNSRIVDVRPSQLMTMTKNPGNMWYMPPEAQGIVTKYNTSIDVFSFGNLMLFTLTQKFPEVKSAAHTDPDTGRVTGLTEIERRSESFTEITHELGRDHPMVQLTEQCLENLPKNRPPISEVVRMLSDTEESVRDEYSHLSKLEMVQLHDREMKQMTSDSALESHQAEIATLKSEIETLQARDKSHQDRIIALEEQLGAKQGQIRSLDEQSAPTAEDITKAKWEIERRSIAFKNVKLGSVYMYKKVWVGIWNGETLVDVKERIPGTKSPEEFLAEAEILKKLSQPNIVQLYGVCTNEEPICIVLESMVNGGLLDYLQSPWGRELKLPQLVKIATQVAGGMAYLERQKCIHRNLAAASVFVAQKNIVKIGNFGYAVYGEKCHVQRDKRTVRFKWAAIDALTTSCFTTKSDVWSFGVLLHEIFSYGRLPYPNMTNKQVCEALEKGYRMPSPPNCPEALYRVMLDCWKQDPEQRPTFEYLQYLFEDNF